MQNLKAAFGKILRIPAVNPFVKSADPGTLGEIYACGCRNPQRLSPDPKDGKMLMADIGQNVNRKVTVVTAGANLGWNIWWNDLRR